jgi:branched-subunit amino acid transport protein
VTWPAILALAAASYALKAVGAVLVGDREIRAPVRALLDLAPVPLLAALILTQTLSTAGAYAIDARLPALGVAGLLVWRRAPFLVVVLAAAATAALLRAAG